MIDYDILTKQLIDLRQTIFWLGTHQQWWPGETQIETRRDYLNYVVPNTRQLADFMLMTETARCIHDEAVGPGAYHLFRLSEDLERAIYQVFRRSASSLAITATDRTTLHRRLARYTGGQAVEEVIGPVSLGTIQDIDDDTTRCVLAKHYEVAFTTGRRVYPYLT